MHARRLITVLGIAAPMALLGAGCGDDGGKDTTGDTNGETPAGEQIEVELEAVGDEGVSGTATLTEADDGGTRVVVELDDEGDTPRPAHLHEGTCEELNPAPKYPLEDVDDGQSETIIEPALEDVRSERLALNVHESAENIENYISCGNLPSDAPDDAAAGGGNTADDGDQPGEETDQGGTEEGGGATGGTGETEDEDDAY